jgi:hypothetical protein
MQQNSEDKGRLCDSTYHNGMNTQLPKVKWFAKSLRHKNPLLDIHKLQILEQSLMQFVLFKSAHAVMRASGTYPSSVKKLSTRPLDTQRVDLVVE